MSTEGGDSTYQPRGQRKKQLVPQPKHPVRTTRSEKGYTDPLLVSDDSDDTVQGEVALEESDRESRRIHIA